MPLPDVQRSPGVLKHILVLSYLHRQKSARCYLNLTFGWFPIGLVIRTGLLSGQVKLNIVKTKYIKKQRLIKS